MIIDGYIGPFPAPKITQILESEIRLVVTEGKVHDVRFHYVAGEEISVGTLDFQYENVKVLFEKEDRQTKAKFGTLVGNIALKKTNLKTQRGFKHGEIAYVRHKEKSLLNYLWKSIEDGVLNTLLPLKIEH